jgi:hypothetical protein
MNTTKNFKQLVTSLIVTPEAYKNALENIKGDGDGGMEFNDVLNLSLSYLCNYSFVGLKDSDYTLESFKAILDKANLDFKLGYTPNILKAYNGTATYKNCEFFSYAYCLVQFDYYFKSIDLKETDFYRYTQHYFNTKNKLPFENYKGDKDYLLKEYAKMDKEGSHRAKFHIKKAFTGALFMLLNELQLPTDFFRNRFSDCREYNAMTKTPREYRRFFPFKFSEYDIKSAFPRFIDEIIGSNISNDVYEKIMNVYSLSRSESKILFNKWLNSGKYKSANEFYTFFEPIYKDKTNQLVDLLTNKEKPFWKVMFYWELVSIESFVDVNSIKNYTRLHDGIFKIDNEYNPPLKFSDLNFVEFSCRRFFSVPSFEIAKNKKIASKYASAIPFDLRNKLIYEINLTEGIDSKRIKDFRIFKEPFYFLNANFNIASNGFIDNGEFCFYEPEHFKEKLQNLANILAYENNFGFLKLKTYLRSILNYITENSVFIFDVDDLLNDIYINISEPIYEHKNHLYNGKNNIDLFEYQKQYYEALKIYDTISLCESIFPIVEQSYKTGNKLFIDFRELGLRKNRGANFMYDLILKFNECNGFFDVRTASSFKDIFDKKRERGHTIQNYSNSVSENATGTNKIRDFDNIDIRPQTKAKLKKWLNLEQDKKQLQKLYFQLKEIIQKGSDVIEITKSNGRNEISIKEIEQNQVEYLPFIEQWQQMKQSFTNEDEFKQQMKTSKLHLTKDEPQHNQIKLLNLKRSIQWYKPQTTPEEEIRLYLQWKEVS